jgi:glucose/arabinose dehydrogenase
MPLILLTDCHVFINSDGSVETITTIGINNPKGLTIDAFGNFYVVNGNHKIIKISPEGKTSFYFDKAGSL